MANNIPEEWEEVEADVLWSLGSALVAFRDAFDEVVATFARSVAPTRTIPRTREEAIIEKLDLKDRFRKLEWWDWGFVRRAETLPEIREIDTVRPLLESARRPDLVLAEVPRRIDLLPPDSRRKFARLLGELIVEVLGLEEPAGVPAAPPPSKPTGPSVATEGKKTEARKTTKSGKTTPKTSSATVSSETRPTAE